MFHTFFEVKSKNLVFIFRIYPFFDQEIENKDIVPHLAFAFLRCNRKHIINFFVDLGKGHSDDKLILRKNVTNNYISVKHFCN